MHTHAQCLLLLLLPFIFQSQVMQSSNVYSKLGERLGLADHQAVLTLMLQKIATNLKVYGSSEGLVHLTLGLFQVRCVSLLHLYGHWPDVWPAAAEAGSCALMLGHHSSHPRSVTT
jgi:hypothetical protein